MNRRKKLSSLAIFFFFFLILLVMIRKWSLDDIQNDLNLVLFFSIFYSILLWGFLKVISIFYKRIKIILLSSYLSISYILILFSLFKIFQKWSVYQFCIKNYTTDEIESFMHMIIRTCSPREDNYAFIFLALSLAFLFSNLDRITHSKKLKIYYEKLLNS